MGGLPRRNPGSLFLQRDTALGLECLGWPLALDIGQHRDDVIVLQRAAVRWHVALVALGRGLARH